MIETRTAPATAGDGRTLRGYAIRFDTETVIAGAFREVVAPSALADLAGADVLALLNHDTGRVIGRTTSGTLRLKRDAYGLAVEIDLPDTPDGQTAWTLVQRQDLAGMSFGFIVTREDWDDTAPGLPLRTIRELELIEVSIVALPAYQTTSIQTKAKRSTTPIAALRARLNADVNRRVHASLRRRVAAAAGAS